VPTGIEDWPSPWDFSQGDRLIRTARAAALRFLDGSPIDAAPGLYRAPGYDPAEPLTSAASAGGERQNRSARSRSAS
jgi:NTE family protein